MSETERLEAIKVGSRYTPPADRAKIFAPFDALKGFREALAQKERITVPRMELSEDMKEDLDRRFKLVRVKDMVTVIYYQDGTYLQMTGMVSKIDLYQKTLTLVNTPIKLLDIRSIKSERIQQILEE